VTRRHSTSNLYRVVSPIGPRALLRPVVSPSLPSLDGKKIGQLWNYMFRGDEVFRMARIGISARYPKAEFVDYRDFGNIHGPDEDQVVSSLPHLLYKKGIEAVICGVGA